MKLLLLIVIIMLFLWNYYLNSANEMVQDLRACQEKLYAKWMAVEKFIHGKRDACKHDGLASNRRRLATAEYHQRHWQEEAEPLEEVPMVPKRPVFGVWRGNPRVELEEGILQRLREEKLNDSQRNVIFRSSNNGDTERYQ